MEKEPKLNEGEPKLVNMNKILDEEELEYARKNKIEWRKSQPGYLYADGIIKNDNDDVLILSYEDNENWELDGKVIFKS